MRREHLVVVLGWKIALRVKGERLLRAHHDGVDEAAQQHQQSQQDVHDANALVIDAGDPLIPQIWNPAFDANPYEGAQQNQHDNRAGDERNRLIEGDGVPTELAEH